MYHGWTMKLVKTLGCRPSNILKVLGIHLPTHGLLPIIKHGLPENPIFKKKYLQIKTYKNLRLGISQPCLMKPQGTYRCFMSGVFLSSGTSGTSGGHRAMGCHQVTASTEATTFCTSASAIARTMCNGSVATSFTWIAGDPPYR